MISTPTKKKLSNKNILIFLKFNTLLMIIKNIFNYFYPHKASFIFKCRTLKV